MKLTHRLSVFSKANNIDIETVLQSGTKLILSEHSGIITVASEKYKLCDPTVGLKHLKPGTQHREQVSTGP
jgi:hypothetical protein